MPQYFAHSSSVKRSSDFNISQEITRITCTCHTKIVPLRSLTLKITIMARRISYIAPIESMSGNISGGQELEYPTNDNKAWDAPEDGASYARNYKPRYVAAVRRSDGRLYFAVKSKTAVRINNDTRMTMAVLGGFGAIYAGIMNDNGLKTALINLYLPQKAAGSFSGTFREFIAEKVVPMLQNRQVAAAFPAYTMPGGIVVPSVTIRSPWFDTDVTGSEVAVLKKTVVKFWDQLNAGVDYYVGKHKGISPAGMPSDTTFEGLMTTVFKTQVGWFNIIPLQIESEAPGYVKYYDQYVTNAAGVYMKATDPILTGGPYRLTYTAPA